MTRTLICLVGAALAAAACGDDAGATSGDTSTSTVGASTTGATTVASVTASGATSSVASASSGGQGGEGGEGGQGTGGIGGSGEGGLGVAPPFRTEVDMADGPLALRALQIVGADVEGSEGNCLPCHALTVGNLTSWEVLTIGVLDECLTDLEVSTPEVAREMIACVQARSGIPGSEKFSTPAVGFWAAGAARDWWKYTFQKAYPEDGEARFQTFVAQVKMPPNLQPSLSSADYDIVGEWFVRGTPLLEELLEEKHPDGCEPFVADEVGEYVAERQESGWRALNASNGMLMHDCPADADNPRDCLADASDASDSWRVDGNGVLKILATLDYQSSFWTRGSADGRYVGHGAWTGGANAAMVDLANDEVIPVNALYDPGFFPDDTGFVFQGGPRNFCTMDVLTSDPEEISMEEQGCSQAFEVGLYQHVGAALDGGDYFAVDGPFVSDDGGHSVTPTNPDAFFGGNSEATLIPMVFNGSTFDARDRIDIDTPFDGDAVISPSAGLLLSRTNGDNGTNGGYHLRKIDATPDGGGSFDVVTTSVGRYCLSGGKPAFSYDERWIVIHHYVEDTDADAIELGFSGKDDPGFSTYADSGAANIVLVDVTTGEAQRITDMPPGRYALFPFFRSDGWIYFISRTSRPDDGELVFASDAALVAEGL